jgi:hypothetical protein
VTTHLKVTCEPSATELLEAVKLVIMAVVCVAVLRTMLCVAAGAAA